MQTSQMSVEDVKRVILRFPKEDKMRLLKELEKEMFSMRLDTLLDDLKNVPLSYDEINEEVEYVRTQRYKRSND
ncbi:MAG: hypothetical protein GY950_37420 [bacterium]|nr:hypothetical protein [bacterium]